MQKYADVVLDRKGNVVPGATVLVKTSAGANADLFSANGTGPISNPVTTDSFGRFFFYAANGRYNLQVYIGSALFTASNDILLEDPLDATPEVIDGGTIRNSALQNVTIDGKAPATNEDLLNKTDPVKGSGGIGFSQALSYAAGTLGAHSKIIVSVTDYPFNAVSGTNATAAFQAAFDAVVEGGVITIPGPGPYTVGAIVGTKKVTWEALYDLNSNIGLLNLPGTVQSRLGSAVSIYRTNAAGTDFASLRSTRLASYTGGTAGNVCSNIYAKTAVSNNLADSFEWVGLFVLDNAGTGQNCAVYGQANRKALSAITRGGTFGGVFESRDLTLEANPTSGLIGIEVDIFANGGDSVGRRIGMDMVIGKGVSEGDPCEVYAGLRFGPTNGISANARFRNAILINGAKDYGMQVLGTGVETSINITATGGKIGVGVGGTNSDADYVSSGTSNYGLRLSGNYASGIAIRVITGAAIALESTGAIKMNYTLGAIQFLNTTVVKNSFNTITGAISIGSNQVLGPRITGWTADTGTSKRGSSATFSQTAPASYSQSSMQAVNDAVAAVTQAMKALKDDLITHGSIGT
jgi:hypothetical protein